MSSLKLFAVESKIEELGKRKRNLETDLEVSENLLTGDDKEIARVVGEFMTQNLTKEDMEEEIDDLDDSLSKLDDVKETLTLGKGLDDMQEAFLNSIGL